MDIKLNPKTWEEAAHWALHKISNALSVGDLDNPTLHAKAIAHAIREDKDYAKYEYEQDGRFWLDYIQLHAESWGFDEIVAVLAEKHAKYGPGNIVGLGHWGIAVRIHDKMERIVHCAELGVVDEENPMFDALGYCVIGVMLNEGWFELPLSTQAAKPLPPPADRGYNAQLVAIPEGEGTFHLEWLIVGTGVSA